MTDEEMFEAMARGHGRFKTKSGRVYLLDPEQRCVLKPFGGKVLLIGFPEESHPRKRGRKWSWLSPANLEVA